ncbi:MAG: ATP-dependent RNA helicase DeaD [Gammaproteobacteria bacterium]|jgi:ATP-dependent RNA helicase DeaD
MTDSTESGVDFASLGLIEPILAGLKDVGYETPSPIQAATIPTILAGTDVLGQAQTGTGKTAAFALPILSNLDLSQRDPQVLVLAPTRELAIQVAEAFQTYASHLPGFRVAPIYGGQGYGNQLSQLKRGVHVVVGTPGRVMDHIERGTLKLHQLKVLVLDEADEMLRMGFVDDVEWILSKSPDDRQIALFSATMPSQIRRMSDKYLVNPEHITIKATAASSVNIRQRVWTVRGMAKMEALTRILEVEEKDGVIIFTRTKTATEEVADKLRARGHAAEALNGDIQQANREKIVQKLKDGRIDILVATDVAARGLDVERISHVINYDIPYDTEAYVHRIGRTGRAGRSGNAILFATPRESRLLKNIERLTASKIEHMDLPSSDDINDVRIGNFRQRITDTIGNSDLTFFKKVVEEYTSENEGASTVDVAAALAQLLQGDVPFLVRKEPPRRERDDHSNDRDSKDWGRGKGDRDDRPARPKKRREEFEDGDKVTYKIDVGHSHDVRPGNIVGAVANEGGIASGQIGRVKIFDNFSLIDLPKNLPKEQLDKVSACWVQGQQLNLRPDSGGPTGGAGGERERKPNFRSRENEGDSRPPRRSSNASEPRSTGGDSPAKKPHRKGGSSEGFKQRKPRS